MINNPESAIFLETARKKLEEAVVEVSQESKPNFWLLSIGFKCYFPFFSNRIGQKINVIKISDEMFKKLFFEFFKEFQKEIFVGVSGEIRKAIKKFVSKNRDLLKGMELR